MASNGDVTDLANGSVSIIKNTDGAMNIHCNDVPETSQVFNTNERLALKMYHDQPLPGTVKRIYYYDAT